MGGCQRGDAFVELMRESEGDWMRSKFLGWRQVEGGGTVQTGP